MALLPNSHSHIWHITCCSGGRFFPQLKENYTNRKLSLSTQLVESLKPTFTYPFPVACVAFYTFVLCSLSFLKSLSQRPKPSLIWSWGSHPHPQFDFATLLKIKWRLALEDLASLVRPPSPPSPSFRSLNFMFETFLVFELDSGFLS